MTARLEMLSLEIFNRDGEIVDVDAILDRNRKSNQVDLDFVKRLGMHKAAKKGGPATRVVLLNVSEQDSGDTQELEFRIKKGAPRDVILGKAAGVLVCAPRPKRRSAFPVKKAKESPGMQQPFALRI